MVAKIYGNHMRLNVEHPTKFTHFMHITERSIYMRISRTQGNIPGAMSIFKLCEYYLDIWKMASKYRNALTFRIHRTLQLIIMILPDESHSTLMAVVARNKTELKTNTVEFSLKANNVRWPLKTK